MEEEVNNDQGQGYVSAVESACPEQQQETASSIQEQHKQYHNWLAQYVRSAAGIAEGQEPQQTPGGVDVSGLVNSIYGAASAYSYVTALKSWAEAVRTLERSQRDLGPSPSAAAKPSGFAIPSSQLNVLSNQEAYTAAVHGAVEALGAAVYAGEVAAYYAHAAIHAVPQLHAVADTISSRMHACRYALRRPASC